MHDRWQKKGGSTLATAVSLVFLFLPGSAEAHTPIKGVGEFANGFFHPFLTPTHLLVLLSMGLLLGQRVPLRLQGAVGVFAAFAAAGLSLTTVRVVSGVYQPILISLGLCSGGLVALAPSLPPWVRLIACAAAGFALGLDSGVDSGATGAATATTLIATWLSLIVCVTDVAFYSSLVPPYKWVQTGIRVAGSWIVAIALLMLAFSLRR